MKKFLAVLFLMVLVSCEQKKNTKNNFTTTFELSDGTETPDYPSIISYYKELSEEYSTISLFSFGETDAGEPLHLVVYNGGGTDNVVEIKNSSKNRILINNGIHPGESDGIDASMLLLRDIVTSDSLKQKYKNTIICVIPVYNVGGSLQRNSHTRANQNGPKEYGFRGNARNLDLNRDFIKQDSKNAAAFAKIFHSINPDVFIDNHVSNGADYQYAITHLFTQHNKLGGDLGLFIEQEMRPSIEQSLYEKKIDITPYVNVWGTTPDKGFSQFFDTPRYSTGYTTMFHTLGLMVETHMLKPYKVRVEQTYELLFSALDFLEEKSTTIKKLRKNALKEIISKKRYPIDFKVNYEYPSEIQFKGYEASEIKSNVTSGNRLFYDQTKPYEKPILYYNNYTPIKEITIPRGYILQQGWHSVVDRLQNNNIQFSRLLKDSIISVEVSHIEDYKTGNTAYEGHYLHYDTTVKKSIQELQFRKGDLYIDTNQFGIRYLLETLEAEASDSFFNWNFFDTILQQKEGYSSYVFEDIALNYIEKHPIIKKEFKEKLKTDTAFAKSPEKQLNYIYKKTDHYESAHLRLPIFKIFK